MSESHQEKHQSARIIKRFVTKLRLVRKPKQSGIGMNDAENVMRSETTKEQELTNIDNIESTDCDHNRFDSAKKLKHFCVEIEKFFNYVKDNEDLTNYIYKYPQILQKRINIDIEELQSLLDEIGSIIKNVKKLKNQDKLIKREVINVKIALRKAKDNETRELESLLAHYDKELYNRWTKSKWKSDALKDLIFDVQEKQIALETLNKLINRCSENNKENNPNEDEDSTENRLVPLSSSIFSVQSKIPIPPPIPNASSSRTSPLTVSTLNKSNSRLSWAQRRFRAERRGNYAPTRTTGTEPYTFSFRMSNSDGINMNFNNNPFEFDPLKFSFNSSETIDENSNETSSSQNQASSSTEQNQDDELKSESQSIFQVNI